jgi:hypothetical protein
VGRQGAGPGVSLVEALAAALKAGASTGTGMNSEMNPQHDGDLDAPVQDVAQEAIDAVANMYTHEPDIDVEQHLRTELSSRGIRSVDGSWLSEIAHGVRSGHRVQVGDSDGSVQPG